MDARFSARYSGKKLMRHLRSLPALFALACPLIHAEQSVTIGYVTAITSPSGFDVNGLHIAVADRTALFLSHGDVTAEAKWTPISVLPQLYLGEEVEVLGDMDRRTRGIPAIKIIASEPAPGRVSGSGVIDLIASDATGTPLVRADGYLLELPAKENLTFLAPLKSPADLRTNLWIKYRGTQRPDGVVEVEKAEISPNLAKHSEERRRSRNEYDPEAVDPADAQGTAAKFLNGADPRRIPPFHDDAMQARIDRIGNSLIPAFQKALPATDPTRIDFRFFLIDDPKRRGAWPLASGIILIPEQVVVRCANDSQIAAILADSIAEILEKQPLSEFANGHKLKTVGLAGQAAGLFIPGVSAAGLATGGASTAWEAGHMNSNDPMRETHQQSARVSLCLMHDAGYDLTEAPKAWWMLAAKSPADPLPKYMPDRTVFLYEGLGTTWHIEGAKKPPSGSGSTSAP